MVIRTAFSFVIIIIINIIMIIMIIVTRVRVYPQEGTVETVSKFHLSCPLSASNLVWWSKAPLSCKGSKDKRSDEFDF